VRERERERERERKREREGIETEGEGVLGTRNTLQSYVHSDLPSPASLPIAHSPMDSSVHYSIHGTGRLQGGLQKGGGLYLALDYWVPNVAAKMNFRVY
jgi:hypothetical protein